MEVKEFINEKVFISASEMTPFYKTAIENNIQKNIIDVVSKNYGYILSYFDLQVKSNEVKRDKIIFYVDFKAECLIPMVDSVFDGVVSNVNRIGLFVDVHGKFKVLINKNTMVNFRYEEPTYIRDNIVIRANSNVSVTIKGLKFEHNMYKCFGSLNL
jgi:DNA-directed RNA polymerase subunit E'/Rpb7